MLTAWSFHGPGVHPVQNTDSAAEHLDYTFNSLHAFYHLEHTFEHLIRHSWHLGIQSMHFLAYASVSLERPILGHVGGA